MKKGDIIVTIRENAGTIAYNVSEGRWCVYSPHGGQSDVNESVMYTALTKEELESLSKEYYKSHEEGYEFVNFHIGQDEIEDAFKNGIINGIEIGYRLAREIINRACNDGYAIEKLPSKRI